MTILSHGHLWSLQLLKTCQVIGVKTVCIAPGSRSTCLVKAASEIPSFNLVTHYDERSLGFFALGAAKYDRTPVVIITTSGSAVANLVPSVTEASALQIPIIYITADRPPELHHCGANQTLEQEPLLNHIVHQQLSILVDSKKNRFQAFSKRIQTLLTSYQKGPIHINMAFREPFLTSSSSFPLKDNLIKIQTKKVATKNSLKLLKTYHQKISNQPIHNNNVLCIVSNTIKSINYKKLVSWSQYNKIPILAECSCSIPWNEPVIRQVDHFINTLSKHHQLPSYIICIGAKWISKPLQELLSQQTNLLLIHDFEVTQNWLNIPCLEIMDQSIDLIDILASQKANQSYYEICLNLANQTNKQSNRLNQTSKLSESRCIKALEPLIQQMNTVFLGNSLTVRHINEHIKPLKTPVKTITQRGVSGIDGLISTMAGLASQEPKRTMGIMGDISFFYDVGGLSLLHNIKNPILLIVINNAGGQIFNKLDINKDPICEPLFVMPQNINIKNIANAYDLTYKKITSTKDLLKLTSSYKTLKTHHIIECIIN
ncbi:MAG: 2-succinyl-5-enolpyruvyl-6-hydroxy-3-cyclohexene-1-carboxylic-acid synthase [Rickettsiales bacterium]|nr:2-succinyl-5-enolpyruvyl-6-hydroxy-3-cyclohexene-1-carboxylic-acid synthase [Rickettsiales bacterium]|tara:strand:- start:3048 stop:4676 length:1629 start_codon:yes stop_codon:yes gene_type:complete